MDAPNSAPSTHVCHGLVHGRSVRPSAAVVAGKTDRPMAPAASAHGPAAAPAQLPAAQQGQATRAGAAGLDLGTAGGTALPIRPGVPGNPPPPSAPRRRAAPMAAPAGARQSPSPR